MGHTLRLADILAALRQLDGEDNDPPRPGGVRSHAAAADLGRRAAAVRMMFTQAILTMVLFGHVTAAFAIPFVAERTRRHYDRAQFGGFRRSILIPQARSHTNIAMTTNSRQYLDSGGGWDRAYLESLIREDFERCHPGEPLEDLKRRASERGQRPSAGLDGGRGGSGRRRTRCRGIALALDDPPRVLTRAANPPSRIPKAPGNVWPLLTAALRRS